MLLAQSTQKDPKSAEYEFHERLGGGIAGRVVRVTDGRGCVFAGKCARTAGDSHGLLQEAHILLSAGTHPNLVKLVGVTLCGAGRLCLGADARDDDRDVPCPVSFYCDAARGIPSFVMAPCNDTQFCVEGAEELVAKGRANAERNGLQVDYHVADLFAREGGEGWLNRDYDYALFDPPRSGAAELLPHLLRRPPQRIVYVSCHPGSLARDAGTLVRAGYRLSAAGVMDMFPHTGHVESIARFDRC